MTSATRYITLTKYADGRELDLDDFALREASVPRPSDGQVLVQTLVLSMEPSLRGSMAGRSDFFRASFGLDEPLHSRGVARVLESRHPDFAPGDLVAGRFAWSELSLASPAPEALAGTGLRHARPDDIKLSYHLGAIGNTGQTAFFGILAVARPTAADTVLVSAAAGGVGSIAGQIAKIMGARVIGLAGSEHKCNVIVDKLGFDAALDYRAPDLGDQLRELMPTGPSIYFDNVGGDLSQLVMGMMPIGGKVVECGQIATYNDPNGGWKVDIRPIHLRRLRFCGFTRSSFAEFLPAANAQLAHWLGTGALVALETERHGLESAPSALLGMFAGDNLGKMFVTVAE